MRGVQAAPVRFGRVAMAIWALADLHLSFGIADKSMDVFGPSWSRWTEKIEENWRKKVAEDDLVLIAGDISWALHTEQALPDLEWIHRLPGMKVMIRGNHDYWLKSMGKAVKILPPSIRLIHHTALEWNGISIGGTRLWDNPEFNFEDYIEMTENPRQHKLTEKECNEAETERIFVRELGRLELSLKAMNPKAKMRIMMTHYPPLSATMEDSRATKLLEKYGVDVVVFGHLHSVRKGMPMFGEKNGIQYILTSGDYLEFDPIQIIEK